VPITALVFDTGSVPVATLKPWRASACARWSSVRASSTVRSSRLRCQPSISADSATCRCPTRCRPRSGSHGPAPGRSSPSPSLSACTGRATAALV